jgi:hypothetical protein
LRQAATHQGYKVVARRGRDYFSLYDGSPITIRGTHRSPKGLYLGTTERFVRDYYTGMIDEDEYDGEAILSYEYSAADLMRGDPAEEGEVVVRQARVVGIENI